MNSTAAKLATNASPDMPFAMAELTAETALTKLTVPEHANRQIFTAAMGTVSRTHRGATVSGTVRTALTKSNVQLANNTNGAAMTARASTKSTDAT
ncbi:unnamed protein product [Acanthoscelides obtectus]|uniref:Uncharacterized protein n=1 Tax=Acanthoscelides obtectus TaxID=200917 RepID=A0A9P0PWA8_ACAOB|nr:unnamed protein product [Acanthoscelides obtectus]